MSKATLTYRPDYGVPPGEVLEELLAARQILKSELARRCGLSAKTMSLIIAGKAPIAPATAIQLERVLGVSASIWNNLEARYRLFLAQKSERVELSRRGDWLQKFPIGELQRRGILTRASDAVELVTQLLDFFGVGSIAAWEERKRRLQVAFRRSPSFESSPEAVATWLRIGELKAVRIECAAFNKDTFTKALQEVKTLSCQDPEVFEPRMKDLCAESGVALVFVRELPGTHLSGATQWLKPDKAMIALSLRYKTDDHLWFTLFHEAGHIMLHGKKEMFVDGAEPDAMGIEEQQANQFASDRLIPRALYNGFVEQAEFSESSVERFAREIGIAPGIVVGRLQHDRRLRWGTFLNHFKCRFKLVESAD